MTDSAVKTKWDFENEEIKSISWRRPNFRSEKSRSGQQTSDNFI